MEIKVKEEFSSFLNFIRNGPVDGWLSQEILEPYKVVHRGCS